MKIIGKSSRGFCFKGCIPGIRAYDQYGLMIGLLFPLVSPASFFPSLFSENTSSQNIFNSFTLVCLVCCVCVGCTCTTVLCVEDVLTLPCVGSKDHTQVGHQAWQQALVPAELSCQPRRGHFNNCLIRLENVSFCFRKNQVVRGDIFDHFLAVNLDQMSVEPAALQQLTPRTLCHSASSFRIPATNKQHQQQRHKLF